MIIHNFAARKLIKMNKLKQIIGILGIAVVMLFSGNSLFGQEGILEPVKWKFSSKEISKTEIELVFKAEIEDKWHLYSQDIPMSPPATVFSFEKNSVYELVGKVEEISKVIEEYDPNFEMELKYYGHEAIFVQKVKLLTDGPVTVKGYLEYMCCDDKRCLPPTEEEFEFSFNQDQKAESGILEPVIWDMKAVKIDDDTYDLTFTAKIDEGFHLYTQEKLENGPLPTEFIFEESDSYKLVGKVEEKIEAHTEYDEIFKLDISFWENEAIFTQRIDLNKQDVEILGEIAYMVCNDKGCVALWQDIEFSFTGGMPAGETTEIAEVAGEAGDSEAEKESLWGFFFLAFVFGLAAILTPCVFPMIPMTVSFFMKDSDKKANGRKQALVYGLSIIFIYVFIGSVLAVFLGPDFANFVSTHWLPNVLFFLIFVIFAASFFGMFELTLPSWMVSKSDAQADKGGVLGAVFMALTLVLVSFSCTGPIVGLILVESAGGLVLKPIIGMLGFSLAFALPFTLFAFFPSWLSNLPKSGGWLNSVKVILGFLELALGLKFLSMADQTYHWGILDREIYLALWIIIFTLMGFYLLGKLKFAHDSEVKHISVPRLALAIISFSFVVYMVPGMFGAPLKALSGYLPPQQSHDFDLNKIVRDNAKTVMQSGGGGGAAESAICEKPKFGDFLHLPHGLEGYFDYEQAIACSREQNKPLFIDFTGHACVNCREMEANVWSAPEVLKRLSNDYIVVALYVDDKTKLPESEWITSTYDGKVKKSIGKKFADLQADKFQRNSQPYYVLLDHDETNLVEPRAYDLDIDEFVDFLDRGLEEFNKRHK